jgi:hypothetical protein
MKMSKQLLAATAALSVPKYVIEAHKLDAERRAIGMSDAAYVEIVAEVNALASASTNWGTLEDRFTEIRRRMRASPEAFRQTWEGKFDDPGEG